MSTAALALPSDRSQQVRLPKAEEIALVVLLATITLDNLSLLGVGQKGIEASDVTPAKLATLAALGIWVFRALINKSPRLLHTATGNLSTLLIYVFLAVSCLSVADNTNVNSAVLAIPPWGVVARRVQLFIVFFVIIAVAQRRRLLDWAIVAFFVGGLVTCYAGCSEMITGKQFLAMTPWQKTELLQGVGGVVRSQGLHEDADHQATFLLVGLAFVPYLWHSASRWYLKFGVALIAALYLVAALGTGAKGGWIGLVMVFAYYLALVPGRRKWLAAAAALLVVAAAFVALGHASTVVTFKKFSSDYRGSDSVRFGLVRMAWETVKDHPILGAGTGSSLYIYHRYFPTVSSAVPNKPYPQLNSFMKVWAENGTVGLGILLLVFLAIFLETALAIRRASDARSKMLGLAVMAAYLAMLWMLNIYAMLDSKYLWMTAGLAIAYGNLTNHSANAR